MCGVRHFQNLIVISGWIGLDTKIIIQSSHFCMCTTDSIETKNVYLQAYILSETV